MIAHMALLEAEQTQAAGAPARRGILRAVPAWIGRMLSRGLDGYPPKIARRLKILNGMAWLIVLSSANYAITFALADLERNQPFVWLNILMVFVGLAVPYMHRFHELAGGMLIAVAEIPAIFAFVAMMGRDAGVQLNLIVGAAAPFFIFGLQRPFLIGIVSGLAIATHMAAWFMFPQEKALIPPDAALIDQLYISSAITTFGIVGALVYYAYSLAQRAEAELDILLRNVLPGTVVDRLTLNPGERVSDSFSDVSVLFTDLAGFVTISRNLGAGRTVELLNHMVSRFDAAATRLGVEKIKTIGDAYMAAACVPEPGTDHARRMIAFAFAIQSAAQETAQRFSIDLPMRIGIATGPVMAGVIGANKFSYDVWGDAVNLAARLESTGRPGCIHVCAKTRAELDGLCTFEHGGDIEIKGFGVTESWFVKDSPLRGEQGQTLAGTGGT